MYVKVLYGQNETLVCNPSCAIVNLFASIRRRAGIKDHRAKLDLSDETGLVKEMNGHNNEMAEKYLVADATYVLLRKLESREDEIIEGYTPLVDNITKYLPGYQVHVKTALGIGRSTRIRGQRSPIQSSKAGAKSSSSTSALTTSANATTSLSTSSLSARPKQSNNGAKSSRRK